MKKFIVIIFIILMVFFTTLVKAEAPMNSDISKFEYEVKKILNTVKPSILKVVAENHRKNFATGIAIENNLVVSNINLIRHPFSHIYIETVKGKKYNAKVLGKDSKSSLILLKIKEKALTPIRHASAFEVGDWVALVGAFYKEFPSIYQGILSSASENQVVLNAPVVPGSSGGAVVNKNGELIGVIRGRISFAFSPDYTFKDHSGEIHIESSKSQHKDLCAAVPVKEVVDISEDLKQFGKVRRGWLGVGLISKSGGPIKINNIVQKSPAEKAGLRIGDIILSIAGKSPKTPNDVGEIIRDLKPQQKVKIEFQRGKARESALVVIGETQNKNYSWSYRIPPSTDIDTFVPEMDRPLPALKNLVYTIGSNRTLGVDVVDLTPQLAKELNVKEGRGLMISNIYKGTAAEKAGFRPLDIIVKVDKKNIDNYSDLREVLNEVKDDQAITVEVYRKGKQKSIKLVPDKRTGFGVMFNRFKDRMKDITVQLEEEELRKVEEAKREEREKLLQVRQKYLKELQTLKDKELKKYKMEIERMRQQQEKMMQEVEKLRKELEKEKQEQEQKKEKERTTTI